MKADGNNLHIQSMNGLAYNVWLQQPSKVSVQKINTQTNQCSLGCCHLYPSHANNKLLGGSGRQSYLWNTNRLELELPISSVSQTQNLTLQIFRELIVNDLQFWTKQFFVIFCCYHFWSLVIAITTLGPSCMDY